MDKDTQVAGYITRKHVYEIAMIKSKDEYWQEFDIQGKPIEWRHTFIVERTIEHRLWRI